MQRNRPVTAGRRRRAEPKKLSAGQRPFVCAGNRPISDTHFAKLTSAKLPFARRSLHGAEEPPTTFIARDQPAALRCTRSLAGAGRVI
jgi:hypothetical protein